MFNKHFSQIYGKVLKNLMLSLTFPVMKPSQTRQIIKAFISSQFGYCPLVWFFRRRLLNNGINCIQDGALQIVYNDESSTFKKFFEKESFFLNLLQELSSS